MSATDLPAGAAEDPEVALPWVRAVLERTADQRGWSSAGLSAAYQSADKAFSEADEASWWGADPATFWAALDRETREGSWSGEPGADSLALLWAAAAGWSVEVQAQQDAQSVLGQAAGAVSASGEDVVAVATTVKTAAQKPTTWILAGVVIVTVGFLALNRSASRALNLYSASLR